MLVRVGHSNGLKVRGKVIAADSETTGMNPYGGLRQLVCNFGTKKKPNIEKRLVHPARAFAWSFCDLEGRTDYLRAKVDPITREVLWSSKQKSAIASIWDNPDIVKVGHNPRFDISMVEGGGGRVRGKVIDTQILAHVATAGDELTYALKPLCKKLFRYPDDDEKRLMQEVNRMRRIGKQRRWSIADKIVGGPKPAKSDMWLTEDDFLEPYSVGDVIRCILIYRGMWKRLMSDSRSRETVEREHELFWVLKDMEDQGVRVHKTDVFRLIKFYDNYKAEQTKIANQHGGKGLNYRSTPQMTKVFYEDRHHLPVFTKRGNYSLNGETLLKMGTGYIISEDEWINRDSQIDTIPIGAKWFRNKKTGARFIKVPPDPLAKAVLEHNAAQQTNNSFLHVYRRYWVREKRRVWVLHPNFKQTGTKTGRLSCSDPNLQQVASETTGRRKADIQSRPREAFGPRPGCMWYLPDYSQIEVWLFAFLSMEKRMQEALLSGEDYHGGIAKRVFGSRPDFEDHRDYYRKCAKLIMFCLLYGGGVFKASKLLKTDVDTAQEFVSDYHSTLPGVRRFMDRLIDKAKTDGEIFNPFGRRYELDRDFAYRAVNYLIQGTAADVMKNGLINVRRTLMRKGWWAKGVRLLVTVHDEIIVEVPNHLHCLPLMRDVIWAMQMDSKRLGIPVRLPVEMKIARSRWSKTCKIELSPEIVGGAKGGKRKAA